MTLKQRSIVAAVLLVALAVAACRERAGTNSATNQNGGATQGVNANAGGGAADFAKLDAEVARLEADAAKRPDDSALRTSVSVAYARRAAAHYEARRLQEALSDYQSALSFDPAHEEAQMRVTQIGQELQPEPKTEDGKPVTVPARPGAQNSNQ